MRKRHVALVAASVLLGAIAITLAVVFTRSDSSSSSTNNSNSSDNNSSSSSNSNRSSTSEGVGSSSSSGEVEVGSSHVQWSIRNGSTKARGVNLGGWLVAEYWMTQESSVWVGEDESAALGGEYIAITSSADPDAMRTRLDTHHATFITEDDIEQIAAAGFNIVRVPVGWWIIGHDSFDTSNTQRWKVFPTGGLDYLDLLITKWAKAHNVAVIISMHAAKGSQNGEAHSAPTDLKKMFWSDYPENVDNTIEVVSFLADRYKDEDAFLGIDLLNEPTGSTDQDVLYTYYQDAYKAIRSTGNDCVLSVMALFYEEGPDQMNGFMEAPDNYTNVWMAWHPYFIWGYENLTDSELITAATTTYQAKVDTWNARDSHNRLFIGEWSVAVNTGQFDDARDKFVDFVDGQLEVLDHVEAGWTFWSWKTSGNYTGWSMKTVLEDSELAPLFLARL